MNIDLIIIFKVLLNLYVAAALQSNQPHIESTLLNSINEVLGSITNVSDVSDCALVNLLLFGNQNYAQVEKSCIINATIKCLVDSERFNGPLL